MLCIIQSGYRLNMCILFVFCLFFPEWLRYAAVVNGVIFTCIENFIFFASICLKLCVYHRKNFHWNLNIQIDPSSKSNRFASSGIFYFIYYGLRVSIMCMYHIFVCSIVLSNESCKSYNFNCMYNACLSFYTSFILFDVHVVYALSWDVQNPSR